MSYVAGLDFGTSGARISVIDTSQVLIYEDKISYGTVDADMWDVCWLSTLEQLLLRIPPAIRAELGELALNGTSATVLLCDAAGQSLTPPLLYNDDRGQACREQLVEIAPTGSPALSATSSLVKLLWWQSALPSATLASAEYLLHQADWLALQLHGQLGLSDYHNALKLGYDVGTLNYPDWLTGLNLKVKLPHVQNPGSLMGYVSQAASDRYGLPQTCAVMAGTTDSIAAFLASGAQNPGEAVTSLGSTLVIKLLSETRVDDSRYGIYSHRLGDLWLVGGASNTGGAVLKAYFSDAELMELSQQIKADFPSNLDYYPLTKPGERFPVSDSAYPPRLTPRPSEPVEFLQGLLEGIARIEARGYALLSKLGAPPPNTIFTAGGGAQNPAWTAIRQRLLPAPVSAAASTEASFGTACLALRGWRQLPVRSNPN